MVIIALFIACILQACVRESMRLRPLSLGIPRITQVDMVLSGYHIPAGTTCIRTSVTALDEAYFHQADQFVPERWLRNSKDYKRVDPFTNLPFGHGARSCIGRRFANLEMYMATMKIVRKYRLEYHHQPAEMDYSTVGKLERDVKIRFIPRD